MSDRTWLSSVPETKQLTAKQVSLIDYLVQGARISDSWQRAGYATEQAARNSMASHAVRLAMDGAIRQRLASGTGAALSFLEQAFRGQIPGLPGGARVTAAIAWLDRAGYPVPRGEAVGNVGENKTLAEMSLPELRAAVAELKALKASPARPLTAEEGLELDRMLE